ncbi:MAG TPA: ATP-binding protein [Bacteroidales bacterium]|jgi:DNA mismatch repair ATPase MutL|nr:ATP-binding protein [Bacteroidales bacterium]HOB77324.1 ATP-binding protein [Bacteroidales bacterium]HPZ60664.1 ATP-binding protein [Bacteroidales bacterium]HQD58164.1 ATP-binding protein [Bacteroidales bacterium]
MKEIVDHIIDIVNNSISAGAQNITIQIEESIKNDYLKLTIIDDGKGIDTDTIKIITDPFFTTKKDKKVGLGISLLKYHAELSEGKFQIKSELNKGTEVIASFKLSHVDRQPLGDIAGTIILLIMAHPNIHFVYKHKTDFGYFVLDTLDIKDIINDICTNGIMRRSLKEYIDENLKQIKAMK